MLYVEFGILENYVYRSEAMRKLVLALPLTHWMALNNLVPMFSSVK